MQLFQRLCVLRESFLKLWNFSEAQLGGAGEIAFALGTLRLALGFFGFGLNLAKTLNQMAQVFNADQAWKRALRDSKDGKRVINAVGTLRHEDHRRIMDEVTAVRRRTLNGVMDLLSAGLTTNEDIGTQLVGVETVSEFQAALRDMNPTANQNNTTTFEDTYTPLPITHQGWRIPFRQIAFRYKRSLGLTESVRQVSESLEDMLFNGDSSINVIVNGSSSSIIGYTTAPNRETLTISDWTDITTNRGVIVEEAIEMVDLAFTGGAVSGPNSMIMYVANDIWTPLQNDESTQKGSKTLKERIEDISQIREVKPAEKLANGEVLIVEMASRTVELALASDIVTVPHQRNNDMSDQEFTTYSVMVPIIKSDRNDKTGIVHGTT